MIFYSATICTKHDMVNRQQIVGILHKKLSELCDANGVDPSECEKRAQTDEEFLYKHAEARQNNLYINYIAGYLAIVEQCIILGWTYDGYKIK